MKPSVTIIGGGLAGCEAAWQLANRGFCVELLEQKPKKRTPAQNSDFLCELVCSNSLRSADIHNAVGLLKEEMRRAGSLIIGMADVHRIPGGGALVVDREGFAEAVTRAITHHPNIKWVAEEAKEIPSCRPLVIATGPLTSDSLAQKIQKLIGHHYLYFYDSIAPVVEADSVDLNIAFKASRYDKGDADYLNCPLTREEYEEFIADLLEAEKVSSKDFEKEIFFEACLPIEVMASRGLMTLAYGPLKPVGLQDPRTGKMPYAVVQLRQDDLHGTLYNLVGFQTRMKYAEQERIFRKIPGLERANFVRLGSMHRNTYLNAPTCLNPDLGLKGHDGIYFAGQICGVEGYVESAAMGLYVGLGLAQKQRVPPLATPPANCAFGALVRHLMSSPGKGFQPMNVNFGLFDIPEEYRKKSKRSQVVEQGLQSFSLWLNPTL